MLISFVVFMFIPHRPGVSTEKMLDASGSRSALLAWRRPMRRNAAPVPGEEITPHGISGLALMMIALSDLYGA
jgi:hypothetical protein